MRAYLSHGMGVNSTALMLLLEDFGIEFESVFVDTGCEYPETYEYLDYLQKLGYDITVIKPNVEGCSTIYEYCKKYRIVPGQFMRWCTEKFKVKPFAQYIQTPCIVFMGIDVSEKHRAFGKPVKKGALTSYPLIDYKIDRRKCVQIIKSHGLRVPRKSACWLCPFAKKREVRELYLKYPDLYEKRKEIERLASERHGRRVTLRVGVTTEEWAMENIPDINGFFN